MDKKSALWALTEVARRQRIPVERVVSDIQAAIDVTRKRIYEHGDMQAIAAWEKIPSVGDAPTPVELVAYLGKQVQEKAVS